MTDYTHRMSLAVPKQHMPAANQLALIAGESPDDINTFTQAGWQDKDGNLYAVCSTVIKPIVLSLLGQDVADSVLQVDGADTAMAQQAMDKVVMYSESVTATPDSIYIAIDYDPLEFFKDLGLTVQEDLHE